MASIIKDVAPQLPLMKTLMIWLKMGLSQRLASVFEFNRVLIISL